MDAKPGLLISSVVAPGVCTAGLYCSFVYYHRILLPFKKVVCFSGNNCFTMVYFKNWLHIKSQISVLACFLQEFTFDFMCKFGILVFIIY